MKRRLISSDEATPAGKQPIRPCSDCPWARARDRMADCAEAHRRQR
jgi:hypothetical protein